LLSCAIKRRKKDNMRAQSFFIILTLGLFTLNCGQVRFTQIKNSSTVSIPKANASAGDIVSVPCGSDSITVPIKILFVVDQSGSNVQTYNGLPDGTCGRRAGCVPATDPKKSFRGNSISAFYKRYQNKENFSWGFESFSKKLAQSLIRENNKNVPFGNAQAMQAAMISFSKSKDGGATPYLAALSYAYGAISHDPDLSSTAEFAAKYYIVFMSDGYPTDTNVGQINSAVQTLVALAPTRINLSTVYYATQYDRHAASVLQRMAFSGNGQFVNVDINTISKISVRDLITLPTISCR
jgi:hypothetical protein